MNNVSVIVQVKKEIIEEDAGWDDTWTNARTTINSNGEEINSNNNTSMAGFPQSHLDFTQHSDIIR